ncbi:molybdate ABC transporter substrate-binding protein [Robiginitalea sp.]|uniref:molybdate ABC transporter substrate-binding protein n=1 Tax=Robiginitalea sp. TaxID=1902411 RepID=UPI003C78BA94
MKTAKWEKHLRVLSVCWVVWLSSCGTADKDRVLTIAGASNIQFALEEISVAFTDQTGIPSHLVTGSSGKLTAQITEGAPYDILISADVKYPGKLYREGYTVGPPRVYAYGKLVLWTLKEGVDPDLSALSRDEIRYIAVANPKTAPYGLAALEVLKNNNLDSVLQAKLVFGESIGQVNQFISSGSAEIGFTALSVVSAPKFENIGQWSVLDSVDYTPIEQGIVVIRKEGGDAQNALLFQEFLFSDSARRILKKYGYTANE